MVRTVFMGTPGFAVPALESLARVSEVVGVFTQPDKPAGRGLDLLPTPVKKKALELGISVFQPVKASSPEGFAQLEALRPDLIVVVAYGHLLKRDVLELPRYGCINVHASLLPRWRGAGPIQWALLSGDIETGVTTMLMAEKLDAGDMLLQAKTVIHPTDTTGTLHDRLSQMGADLISPTIEGWISGQIQARKQDETRVTYAPKLTKAMEWLDPRKSADELDRQIRALEPWPGTSIRLESGERVKIRRAVAERIASGHRIGEVFVTKGAAYLSVADGVLRLEQVQPEGRKPVDGVGFVNGWRGRGKGSLRVVAEKDKAE